MFFLREMKGRRRGRGSEGIKHYFELQGAQQVKFMLYVCLTQRERKLMNAKRKNVEKRRRKKMKPNTTMRDREKTMRCNNNEIEKEN